MRLSIIPLDGTVCVNGVCKTSLDLSQCGIPDGVHALQWYETNGEIEWSYPIAKNEQISILPTWANLCVDIFDKKEPEPAPPSALEITKKTVNTASGFLQTFSFLATPEMSQHITPESRQEVTDYIHAVANILATAQSKYGTGEAYAPEFPPMPTAVPQLGSADTLPAPYIRFVAGE